MANKSLPGTLKLHHLEKKPTSQSQLRNAREYLIESESRFRHLVENVADYAIVLLDPDGFVQSWNTGAQLISGYSDQDAIGKHVSLFSAPEEIAGRHAEHELEVARVEGRVEEEGWRVRKDGSRFWASVIITRLTDSSGALLGFAQVTRDLTERRMAEERLRMSEERFRLLVSAVRDYAIFMLDPTGRVATWNEGAQQLKGYKPEEIIGQHLAKFYPEEEVRAGKPDLELKVATQTGRFEDEGWRIRKDGTRFWANVVLTAIKNADGKILGFTKVTRDMTERRRLEEELRAANEELEKRVKNRTLELQQAVQARDEFMSIVSHELRTPVTTLKLQIQTALRQLARNDLKAFNEKSVKFVTTAGRQLDQLSRLINDMFDVSRISMDKLTIEMSPIELNALVQEVAESFDDYCKSKGCGVHVTSSELVKVAGDRIRLEQVISNILINSLKYGEGKPISISVSKTKTTAIIDIEDQGMGIDPKDQIRIFERFERAISASTVSGMGLGLFISRKIVQAHHGEISVRSEVGRGSVFTVKLPLLMR